MDIDFESLVSEGTLGFYKSCEVTTIFIFDKNSKKTFNFYTLINFEEKEFCGTNKKILNERPLDLTSNLILGIIQYNLNLLDIKKLYYSLLEVNDWELEGQKLNFNKFTKINKQFIKPNGTKSIPLNSILKNNYNNGSYIIEFFDAIKSFPNTKLTNELFPKINEFIKRYLPIDLEYISDRVGNIIFQFPSKILDVSITANDEWDEMKLKVVFDEKIQTDKYKVLITGTHDSSIMGFGLKDGVDDNIFEIKTGSTSYLNDVSIVDSQNNIIAYASTFSFMKEMNFIMDISTQHSQQRTINLKSESHEIAIVSQSDNKVKRNLDYKDWISKRTYKNEKDELTRRLEFVQYGITGNERNKALGDIRKLIDIYGRDGVYLWDPYLTSEDILETLYHCKYIGVEMKAITSYDKKRRKIYSKEIVCEKNTLTIDEWKDYQRNSFLDSSNNLGINLEFRCQHGEFGWKFHDRFLIFPIKDFAPKVWSLGISVNGLGKEHHILQHVSNPQNILDAFNELWHELNNDKCLIWRSK
ncbi:VPA1262 family N-terminal domain-containing protein [Bacillus sp. FJAT-22090]|uniref:VPA1262 family N-terminal domain-containing protein n=1 Tax=Bacillus sp. FJAT-22090 TaxID=1581038 RepID=UPI0006AFACF6|nr:VPA1262 family N-terminal domain-containing protein [Bacillus sp. FJAT-22090]